MYTRTSTILILCLSLIFSKQSIAQKFSPLAQSTDYECGTVTSPTDMTSLRNIWQSNQATENQFLNTFNLNNKLPAINIPIKAHIVRTNAGTGGYSLTNLNAAIALMNSYYTNANMQFYLCGGVNYIDNSTYYDFDSSDEAAMTGPNNDPNNINIYFMNSATSGGNAVCGYAYYPGGPNTIIMVNSCADNGSTLSHEMGHFYSVIHTHGGSSSELVNGSNCNTEGDELCDTPADPNLSGQVNTSCIYTGTATDANSQAYTPDPNNIMSYSRKACRNFFSPMQYARINAVAISHPDRINYSCAMVSEDAGIVHVSHPEDNSSFCDNPLIPEVTLENFSSTTLTSVTINYQIDNGPISVYAWSGSLATGATTTIVLPSIALPVNPNITFKAYTTNPNSTLDNNNTNDTTTVLAQHLTTAPAIPYLEPFSGGAIPSDITTIDPDSDTFEWLHTTTANGYGGAGGSIVMDNFTDDTRNTEDWFVLPILDLSGSTGTTLTFDVAYARYNATYTDSLSVVVNDDCGSNFTPVYNEGNTGLATAPDVTTLFVPTAAQWRTETVDLSAYDNMPFVKVAFINKGGWGQTMYIDNINITQGCTAVNSTDIISTCNTLTWIDGNNYSSSNNTATHLITGGAANGCDSVVTLDLTILNNGNGTDTRSECSPYTWIDGNSYTANNSSATYNIVGGATNGCDSITTLNLTINTVNINTSTNSNTITANATTATYRWLDCNNNYAVISGAISQQYTSAVTGNFAVEVTQNGCVDTSACVNIIIAGINENTLTDQIHIYPNPNEGIVNVELGNLSNVSVKVLNITGQVIHFKEGIKSNKYQFELNAAAGVYFIEVSANEIKQEFKLLKK